MTSTNKKSKKPLVLVSQDHATRWIPAQSDCFTVNGLPWFEENSRGFIRFPKRLESKVNRDLWAVSQNTSGARVRFKTDSTSLKLRIQHNVCCLATHNLCARGASGIDLYEGPLSKMAFWCNNEPGSLNSPYICTYFTGLPKKIREFTLYLPTYSNVASLEIGLDKNAKILPPSSFKISKPVVFYGSSITQGGCATRGGKGFVPILGRRFGIDVVNLGFSGLGRYEPEVSECISEIDAACYVLACVANLDPAAAEQRYEKFVDYLHQKRPNTPILLLPRIRFANESFAGDDYWQGITKPVLRTYEKYKKQNVKNIHLYRIDEAFPIGPDHPTVDGVHPSDEGFRIMADALTPVLGKILKLKPL
jgi:lysophospholipase L1-like esterase